MVECAPWLGAERWPMSTIKLHHDWLLFVAYLRALYY